MQYLDGSCYAGAWRAGERQGQGRLRTPAGDVFLGGFVDGHRTGPGTLLMVRCSVPATLFSARLCRVMFRQEHMWVGAGAGPLMF